MFMFMFSEDRSKIVSLVLYTVLLFAAAVLKPKELVDGRRSLSELHRLYNFVGFNVN